MSKTKMKTKTRVDRGIPRYTLADVRALRPCYDEAQLRRAFGRAATRGLTALEISRKRSIPVADRLWVLWRVLPAPIRAAAVERTVARVVRAYALPHVSTRTWAERWLSGKDRTRTAARAAEAAARAAWAAGERQYQLHDIRVCLREATP